MAKLRLEEALEPRGRVGKMVVFDARRRLKASLLNPVSLVGEGRPSYVHSPDPMPGETERNRAALKDLAKRLRRDFVDAERRAGRRPEEDEVLAAVAKGMDRETGNEPTEDQVRSLLESEETDAMALSREIGAHIKRHGAKSAAMAFAWALKDAAPGEGEMLRVLNRAATF